MTTCPCCSYPMVQYFRNHQTVLFCRHCWQDMPDLGLQNANLLLEQQSLEQLVQQSAAWPLVLTA